MIDPAHLADIEAIRQLKARYFRHLDTKNWSEWRKVFTDDVEIRVDVTVDKDGAGGLYPEHPKGGDAFVAHISDFLKPPFMTVHHGHTSEIAITGPDTATGIWAMEDIVSPTPDTTIWGYGHYHERYRKESGEWRIAGFHLKRLRFDYGGAPGNPEEHVGAMLQSVEMALLP